MAAPKRPTKKRGFGISIKVSQGLIDAQGRVRRHEGRFLTRVAEKSREPLARAAPGGAGGLIGQSLRVVPALLGRPVSHVRTNHPGADALDRGAWITPAGLRDLGEAELRRQKRRLRFEVDGRTVFVPFVRIKATGWVKKGLRPRRRLINEAFAETHADGSSEPTVEIS